MNMISEQIKELRDCVLRWQNFEKVSSSEPFKLLNEAANTIESLSAKLQAANMERSAADYGGWIPCSERLPEESGYYLCTIFCEDGRVLVKTIYFNHLHMWIEDCTDVIYPNAWMPVPEPYHEP